MYAKFALIGFSLVAVVIIAGCMYGPKRVTYNVLAGTEITVDEAMQLWGQYVKDFHPPVAQEKQVADAFTKYQLAEEEAIDAARLAITLTGNADAETKRAQTARTASQALGELVGLMRQFGVKI